MILMVIATFIILCVAYPYIWEGEAPGALGLLWIAFASYFWPITWLIAWIYGLGLLVTWAYGDIWRAEWR